MEEEEETPVCSHCGAEIVYTDVLGLHWCQTCFHEIYLEEPKPLT